MNDFIAMKIDLYCEYKAKGEIYMIHGLKTWKEYFIEVANGNKTFEVRKNDRNFKVGDRLILKEYDNKSEELTGREIMKEISYVLHGGTFGIEKDYVVLGLRSVA